jgi:hypothetical protein
LTNQTETTIERKDPATEAQDFITEGLEPTALSKASPEVAAQELHVLAQHIQEGYVAQDYVRQIIVHPDDVQFVTEWVDSQNLPGIVRGLIHVVPNGGDRSDIGVVIQSQVETEWLAANFRDQGVIDIIRAAGAPIILNHRDMKLLFLVRALLECESKRKKILIPGT